MTKEEIIKKVRYWKEVLGLINWEISILLLDIPEKNKAGAEFMTVSGAQTQADPQYKTAYIQFDPKFLPFCKESTIVHEMLHVLTYELMVNCESQVKNQQEFNYMNEQLTTDLERIILRLHSKETFVHEAVFPANTDKSKEP